LYEPRRKGLFQPDDFQAAVELIDPQSLVDRGIKALLLDIDNTLVPRELPISSLPPTSEPICPKSAQPQGAITASSDPQRLNTLGANRPQSERQAINRQLPRVSGQLPESVAQWVAAAKASGLSVCLLSNNWHRVVFSYAAQLDVPCVYKAMKPLPFAFRRALRRIGAQASATMVIGDQLFTDVLGARLLGMPVIMVQPRSSTDLWYTLLLRRLERRLMGQR
jgi:HAD superfamily phosphatase (TIGR01668 family)